MSAEVRAPSSVERVLEDAREAGSRRIASSALTSAASARPRRRRRSHAPPVPPRASKSSGARASGPSIVPTGLGGGNRGGAAREDEPVTALGAEPVAVVRSSSPQAGQVARRAIAVEERAGASPTASSLARHLVVEVVLPQQGQSVTDQYARARSSRARAVASHRSQ